jgi:hypothetical protein
MTDDEPITLREVFQCAAAILENLRRASDVRRCGLVDVSCRSCGAGLQMRPALDGAFIIMGEGLKRCAAPTFAERQDK